MGCCQRLGFLKIMNRAINHKLRKDFMKQNPELVAKDNAMGFLSDDEGENYNHCHCMSC